MSGYETLAKNVVKRTLRIKPKENVIVECWTHGLPIATEFVHQVRAVGARPMLLLEDEATFWRSATTLPKPKVGQVGSHEWAALEAADAYVFVPGPSDIGRIRRVGFGTWRASIAYNEEWYRRAERAGLRGARIGLGYVTKARARAYGLDLEGWRRSMVSASGVEPRTMERAAGKARRLLSGGGRVEVRARNGTRLSFDLKGRPVGVDVGVWTKALGAHDVMVNIPSGELYVTPDEGSAEGTIAFDRPVAVTGRWLRGLTFAFDGGRLSKWHAARNADLVRPSWEESGGDRDRIGLFQIGLNPRARTGFLHDYIVRGNAYVAVGSNEDYGGRNKTDFYLGATLTGATVTVDGTALLRNGKLAA